MNIKISFETFTATETEMVTGVNKSRQRDWRRRGLLGEISGHARYDLFSLSEIMAYDLVIQKGISASELTPSIGSIGQTIAYKVLEYTHAYNGDFNLINEQAWKFYKDKIGDKSITDALEKSLKQRSYGHYLRDIISKEKNLINSSLADYLIVGSYGKVRFASFNNENHPKIYGLSQEVLRLSFEDESTVYVILDLQEIAKRLLNLTHKNFVNFTPVKSD